MKNMIYGSKNTIRSYSIQFCYLILYVLWQLGPRLSSEFYARTCLSRTSTGVLAIAERSGNRSKQVAVV